MLHVRSDASAVHPMRPHRISFFLIVVDASRAVLDRSVALHGCPCRSVRLQLSAARPFCFVSLQPPDRYCRHMLSSTAASTHATSRRQRCLTPCALHRAARSSTKRSHSVPRLCLPAVAPGSAAGSVTDCVPYTVRTPEQQHTHNTGRRGLT